MDGQKPNSETYKVAILWRGDAQARRAATPQNNRFHRIFEELDALGIRAEPAVYAEEFADDVREQLLSADGVLVWVDPIHQGRTRAALDPLLRDVTTRGPWVSAHPDVIMKMGVKEVLHRTKRLGWGADTHLYRSAAEFASSFPSRLQSSGPRVLKQNRGNAGQGVWKVELVSDQAGAAKIVRVLQAQRGSIPQDMRLEEFMTRCEPYFDADGCMVDVRAAPARRDDPVLHGRRQGCRVRTPIDQGADPATARRTRLSGRAARSTHHAWRRRGTLPDTAGQDGRRVDPANDAPSRPRRSILADHLGRRFPLWAAHRHRRGHLCSVRNQCEFVLLDPRPGAGGDCLAGNAPVTRSASGEPTFRGSIAAFQKRRGSSRRGITGAARAPLWSGRQHH